MQDISLHLLDIVENSIRAGATEIEITVTDDAVSDMLTVEIGDNGEGMDEETKKQALDPFFSSKEGKRIGLGLPLLAQAAQEGGGSFTLESSPRMGTKIRAEFVRSHPDRKPLGSLDETVQVLRFSHPEISFEYRFEQK